MPASIVRRLKYDHDLPGLVKILRNPDDPTLRREAAAALGELQDYEAVEFLARAALQDPDLEVRKAARQALFTVMGNEAELVLSSYRGSLPVNDAWLSAIPADNTPQTDQDNEEDLESDWEEVDEADVAEFFEGAGELPEDADQDQALQEWDQQNLDGLISVLFHETNPGMRLRAINALQTSSNMRVIEALSTIALYDDSEQIRQAARNSLEERFGDDANGIIESYRKGGAEEGIYSEDLESEDEELEEEDDSSQALADIPLSTTTFGDYKPSSVIQEDRIRGRFILLGLLVILIVGGLVLLLLSR